MKTVRYIVAVLLFIAVPLAASAPKKKRTTRKPAASFDYYLLSLSWAPDFCSLNPQKVDSAECAHDRKTGFVVHGLWPQYDRGMGPLSCSDTPLDAQSRKVALQFLPDADLARHEWQKHGTCSGLSAQEYFTKLGDAFHSIQIPPAYLALDRIAQVTPQSMVAEFARTNNAPAEAFRVSCKSGELQELEVCFDKNFQLRPCGKINACQSKQIKVLPLR